MASEQTQGVSLSKWAKDQIKQDEIDRYLIDGKDFIDDEKINSLLDSAKTKKASPEEIRNIIQKAFDIKLMNDEDVAALVNVSDPALREEVFEAAKKVKDKVYDNRIVLFAPLYLGSKCVNGCKYCGFRDCNEGIQRRVLTQEEILAETHVLATEIGHKRLVVVFGEHPDTNADYMAESMKTIYGYHERVRNGEGVIRRVNVNAAPLSIADLDKIRLAGVGTYQVFQETYSHETYAKVHPANSIKGNYGWRLYAHHRAMEAGIDDVAIGTLLGLTDWRFEIMGMVAHARALETRFGLGPHTVSVPRLEPAAGVDFSWVKDWVSDEDFKYLVAVLRLAIPTAGLIVTNREKPEMLRSLVDIITQRDADSRLGIGAYADASKRGKFKKHLEEGVPENQEAERQQFVLGDTRSLDAIIRELAADGHIVSFCTAGYRCGRTGKKIMNLLKTGVEGCFCKLNAVLTFREWLDDFATPETMRIGQEIIDKELAAVKERVGGDYTPILYEKFMETYQKIVDGKRDLYF